jgi:5-methylcytosine-specific restriction endonuclease McrA
MNYRDGYIENLEDNGYDVRSCGCERCGRTTGDRFSVHHIVYKSEAPKHKNLDDHRNLIFICETCHSWFHGSKKRRDDLVKKRKLWELFPLLLRRDFYEQEKQDELLKAQLNGYV